MQITAEGCLRRNEDMLQLYKCLPSLCPLVAPLKMRKLRTVWTNPNSSTVFQEQPIFLIRLRLNVLLQDQATTNMT